MSEVSSLVQFLERFRHFSAGFSKEGNEAFVKKTEPIINGYKTARQLDLELDRKQATGYNLFDILNIRYAETKAHTPFLVNLLNPNGSHGQQDLFLTSFINWFVPTEKRNNFLLDASSDYWVKQEHRFNDGQIDILIRSHDRKRKFGLIIENKLLAPDQNEQIERYNQYLQRLRLSSDQLMIFYLTIEGKDPKQLSVKRKSLKTMKEIGLFRNLSYKQDILAWLQTQHEKVEATKVRQIVQQYIDTLKTL